MEAVSHAGACLGILASDGIVLAAERKNTNKLLDDGLFSEKIFKLDEWVYFVNRIHHVDMNVVWRARPSCLSRDESTSLLPFA